MTSLPRQRASSKRAHLVDNGIRGSRTAGGFGWHELRPADR